MKEAPNEQLPEYVKMYSVPGQDEVSAHSFKRYKEDEKYIGEIEELAKVSVENVKTVPESERADLIRRALESNDPNVQLKGAQIIFLAPRSEKAGLIKKALESDDPKVQLMGSHMIYYAQNSEKTDLINIVFRNTKKALESDDPKVQLVGAGMIYHASDNERADLKNIVFQNTKKALESSPLNGLEIWKQMLDYAPDNKKADLIKIALESDDPKVQLVGAELTYCAPDNEVAGLRNIVSKKTKDNLESDDPKVQLVGALMIYQASVEDRVDLRSMVSKNIKQALDNSNADVQEMWAEMTYYVPDNEKADIIKRVLDSDYPNVQLVGAQMIYCAPHNERDDLRDIVSQKAKKNLESDNAKVQEIGGKMIRYAPDYERATLIRKALESSNLETQRIGVLMLRYVPIGDQSLLTEQIIKLGLGSYLIEPPLYDNQEMDGESFSRKEFKKTGSQTILIGGELKDKVILRRVPPTAFLAWKKIYENHQLWRDAGFDYVPIEPILSYRPNKDGLVDVYSGVLDLSLRVWLLKTTMFKGELNEQKNRILSVLSDSRIKHGHEHGNNFCLRFFRDENGQPDFSKVPRLYLIDFDQANS
ncbi:MAG: hypothetical protein COU06_01680 [Candidatus Harrisonbacteria bacterium CG10_big_fil_rev_8_21_14_0_10_38_8]|uniref:Uncharacterized protein n=1 Tax=Candidatus Harrisonbacteria bacterium CG10_big_fil_rev_8_21_14_0_10_38_8 TaxID=1974582 RepID=A0A2M6WK22_9BACT|nr:MAG: hypothetical protein COU06_01680 [Candidatus Harrisonbacteria bacterium CG10_big_fil_rev_8_21_14_0_10_38_8]